MLIDENSSPLMKSAYESGKKEGIKEGMERAAQIVNKMKPDREDAPDYWDCLDVVENTLRKEIK